MLILFIIICSSCITNAVQDNRAEVIQKAKQVIAELKDNPNRDLNEILGLLENMSEDSDERLEIVPAKSAADAVINYSLSSKLEEKLGNLSRISMSDSSDTKSAAQGIVQLTLLAKFGKNLENMYFLGLLYFNLHYQDPEFQLSYLAMSAKIFLKFYKLYLESGHSKNNIRLAKGLIRAAYATYKIGDVQKCKEIMNLLSEQHSAYKPSDLEKLFLKQIKFT